MSAAKVFVSRLAGVTVFDASGDKLGRLRDVIVVYRHEHSPRVVGLLVEVPGKSRVFVSINKLASIGAGQIVIEGPISSRRFEQRGEEVRVLGELTGQRAELIEPGEGASSAGPASAPRARVSGGVEVTIEDVAIEQSPDGDWHVGQVFVRLPKKGTSVFGKGPTRQVRWGELRQEESHTTEASAQRFLTAHSELRASDLASELLDLPRERMIEIVEEIPDDRLADVLEEMPEDRSVDILDELDDDRAADVLDQMDPDDAADIIAQLSGERAAHLLDLMEPEEADDVRMLLRFASNTAGGLMTTDPIIVASDATVAEALALIRRNDVVATLATSVFVTLPPYEPPTGKLLGIAHFQRLLRYPPHERISNVLDSDVEPVTYDTPDSVVARTFANYDLVVLPVVDEQDHLLGAITIDDVLDHLLPDDWRTNSEPRSPRAADRAARRDSGFGAAETAHRTTHERG